MAIGTYFYSSIQKALAIPIDHPHWERELPKGRAMSLEQIQSLCLVVFPRFMTTCVYIARREAPELAMCSISHMFINFIENQGQLYPCISSEVSHQSPFQATSLETEHPNFGRVTDRYSTWTDVKHCIGQLFLASLLLQHHDSTGPNLVGVAWLYNHNGRKVRGFPSWRKTPWFSFLFSAISPNPIHMTESVSSLPK